MPSAVPGGTLRQMQQYKNVEDGKHVGVHCTILWIFTTFNDKIFSCTVLSSFVFCFNFPVIKSYNTYTFPIQKVALPAMSPTLLKPAGGKCPWTHFMAGRLGLRGLGKFKAKELQGLGCSLSHTHPGSLQQPATPSRSTLEACPDAPGGAAASQCAPRHLGQHREATWSPVLISSGLKDRVPGGFSTGLARSAAGSPVC